MFLADADATDALGRRLGQAACAGDLLALSGDLGMGKSSLARAIGRGLGIERRMPSPTFVIANSYAEGRLPFQHLDLYRLCDAEELEQLGLEELFDGAVVAVEWAERFPEVLPPDHLRATLVEAANGREVGFHATGERAEAWLRRAGL